MGGRTIAVFTGDLDVTADAVIVELHRRQIDVFRCDPAEFPTNLRMAARFDHGWAGHVHTARRTLDLAEVGCAWWRRPTPITVPSEVPESAWVQREAVAGLRGLLAALPWLNHPDDIRRGRAQAAAIGHSRARRTHGSSDVSNQRSQRARDVRR